MKNTTKHYSAFTMMDRRKYTIPGSRLKNSLAQAKKAIDKGLPGVKARIYERIDQWTEDAWMRGNTKYNVYDRINGSWEKVGSYDLYSEKTIAKQLEYQEVYIEKYRKEAIKEDEILSVSEWIHKNDSTIEDFIDFLVEYYPIKEG